MTSLAGFLEMSRWTEFINSPKSCVIAAAGHGKTYAISECLKELSLSILKPALILTHTHAGVASIKEKIKENHIPRESYQIETITSFAQRYALSFVVDTSVFPDQEQKEYFPRIQSEAKSILSKPSIQKIIKLSYSHLFVDEYQDCSLIQHEIILSLAAVLPIHIFGDPLQAIFTFDAEAKVNFTQHLMGFLRFNLLETPWRWRVNGNCQGLGDRILSLRESLMNNRQILLSSDASSNVQVFLCEADFLDYSNDYYRLIQSVLRLFRTGSTLLLVPGFIYNGRLRGNINDRVMIQERIDFRHEFMLIEAIDDQDYYTLSDSIDNLFISFRRARNKILNIKKALYSLHFKKGDIDEWFHGNEYIKTRQKEYKEPSLRLQSLFSSFESNPSLTSFRSILRFFSVECHYHNKRPDIIHAIQLCMNEAISSGDKMRDCMIRYKNRIRRVGRKIEGKCIGTTLLTKGLEFDNVIILDAHRFADKQNFYVAISRACKNLVIISKEQVLLF